MKHIARAAIGLALVLTLGACHRSGDGVAAWSRAMELKVYQGQPGRMEHLAYALDSSLAPLKGHATMAGPGELLVYAPRDEQPSIAAAIEQLEKASSAINTAPLRVRFWMVEAQPGAGSLGGCVEGVAGKYGTTAFRAARGVVTGLTVRLAVWP